MEKTLLFLSGKKTIIVSIIMILAWYLLDKGYIGQAEFVAVGAICSIFWYVASSATKQIYKDQ